MFGFTRSDGKSKTFGDNCWRFYNSSGELLAVVPASALGLHASTHENGGVDEIETANLGTSETNTELRLAPDGIGGVEWAVTESGHQWSVLTNGIVDFPELIFADGDVIMLEF